MDHEIVYLMKIVVPINQETTKLYSVDDDMLIMGLKTALNRIDMVIEKDGFITLERIFRILEMRASPECPHILFDALTDYGYEEDILELSLSYSFETTPIFAKNTKPDKVVKMSHISRKPRVEQEAAEDDIQEWKPDTQQTSYPKETSESGESEKT